MSYTFFCQAIIHHSTYVQCSYHSLRFPRMKSYISSRYMATHMISSTYSYHFPSPFWWSNIVQCVPSLCPKIKRWQPSVTLTYIMCCGCWTTTYSVYKVPKTSHAHYILLLWSTKFYWSDSNTFLGRNMVEFFLKHFIFDENTSIPSYTHTRAHACGFFIVTLQVSCSNKILYCFAIRSDFFCKYK